MSVALTLAALTLVVLAADVPCNVKKSLKLAEGRAKAEWFSCTSSSGGFIKPATTGVAGVKSTDGSTFQVFALSQDDFITYGANPSAALASCGYTGCNDAVKEWRRIVPHTYAVLVICVDANAGSIISANCDIEVDLVIGVAVDNVPAGQCQTGLYCRDTCGIPLSAGRSLTDTGFCCADCSRIAVVTPSPCRNSCPALGATAATSKPVIDPRPAAAGACQSTAYCLQYCGDARKNAGFGVCCAGCQGDTSDFLSITNGVCRSSCSAYAGDGSITLAPSTTQKVITTTTAVVSGCDCNCVQQRCRDECGTKGVSINACSSNNGVIVEKTCQCRAVAATPPVTNSSGVTLMMNYFIIIIVVVAVIVFFAH